MQNPESVGTLFNTLSARIRGASIELEDLGEEQDDYTKSTAKLRDLVKGTTGFDILEEDGKTFKDIYDIIVGIGEQWSSLDDITRAGLGEALAGKRNTRGLYAVFDNLDTLKNAYQTSLTSEGSALKEEERLTESVAFKINQAKASLEELANDFLSSDLLGTIIQFGDGVIRVLDSVIDKGPSILNIFSAFAGMDLLKGFMGADSVAGTIIGAIASTKTGKDASQNMIVNLKSIFSGASDGIEKEGNQVGKSIIQSIISGMSEGYASKGIAGAIGGIFKGALSSIGIPGLIAGGVLAAVGVGTAIKAHQDKVTQNLRDGAKEAADNWTQSAKSLSDYENKYIELNKTLQQGSLSEEETISIKQQIYELQQQIVTEYGSQVEGINLVNGSLETQLGILDSIAKKKAEDILVENAKNFAQNDKDYLDTEQQFFTTQYGSRPDVWNIVNDALKQNFKNNEVSLEDLQWSGGALNLDIKKPENATEALETYGKLREVLGDLKDYYKSDTGAFSILNNLFKGVDEYYTNNASSWKQYSDVQKSQQQALLYSNGGGKIERNYLNAIKELNKAATSGTNAEFQRARKQFAQQVNDARTAMAGLGLDGEYVTNTFKNWDAQLDQSVIKGRDLSEIFGSDDFKTFMESDSDIFNKKKIEENISDTNTLKSNIEDIYNYSKDLKKKKLDKYDILSNPNRYSKLLNNMAESLDIELNINDEGSLSSFLDQLSQASLIAGDATASVQASGQSLQDFITNIESAATSFTALNTAVSESVGGSGITSETINNLKTLFGSDLDSLLERTANGFHINTRALAEYNQQSRLTAKSSYLGALSEQYAKLNEINQQLDEAQTAEGFNALYSQRDAILANIESIKDAYTQYEGVTSMFQQWKAASSDGNERDMYTSMFEAYDSIGTMMEQGWFGNDVRTWLQLMTGNTEMLTAGADDLIDAYNKFGTEELKTLSGESLGHTMMSYFTKDGDGNLSSEGIFKFFEDIEKAFGSDFYDSETGIFDLTNGKLEKVMDHWGIGKEVVEAFARAADEAGYNLTAFLDDADKVQYLNEKASEAKTTLKDMGVILDKDIKMNPKTFEEASKSIEGIQKMMDELDENDPQFEEKYGLLNDILESLVAQEKEFANTQEKAEKMQERRIAAQNKLNSLVEKDQASDTKSFTRDDKGRLQLSENASEDAKEAYNQTKELIRAEAEAATGYSQALASVNLKEISDQTSRSAIEGLQNYQSAVASLAEAKQGLESGITVQADVDSAEADVQSFASELQTILTDEHSVKILADLGINTDALSEQLGILTSNDSSNEQKESATTAISELLGGTDLSKLFTSDSEKNQAAIGSAAQTVVTAVQTVTSALSSLASELPSMISAAVKGETYEPPQEVKNSQNAQDYQQNREQYLSGGRGNTPSKKALEKEQGKLRAEIDQSRWERDTEYYRDQKNNLHYQELHERFGNKDWKNFAEMEVQLKADTSDVEETNSEIESTDVEETVTQKVDNTETQQAEQEIESTPIEQRIRQVLDTSSTKFSGVTPLIPDVENYTIAQEIITTVVGQEEVEELKNTEDSLYDKTVEAIALAIGQGDVEGLVEIVGGLTGKTVTVEADASGEEKLEALKNRIAILDYINKTFGVSVNVEGDQIVQQLCSDLGVLPSQITSTIDVEQTGEDPEEINEEVEGITTEKIVSVETRYTGGNVPEMQTGTMTINTKVNDSNIKKDYNGKMSLTADTTQAETAINSLTEGDKHVEIPVSANADEANSKIEEVVNKEIEPKTFDVDADTGGANDKLDELESRRIPNKTFHVSANASSAYSTLSSIEGTTLSNKSFSVSVNEGTTLSTLENIINHLDSIKSKTITITTKYQTQGSPGTGGTKLANGTAHSHGTAIGGFAHATGTAHARGFQWGGNWALPHNERNALINELGTELIVNKN